MSKACTHCQSTEHTSFACYQRPRTLIKRSTKPLKRSPLRQLGNAQKRWIATRQKWIKLHPFPYYTCHYCGHGIGKSEMTLDHKEARSRRPDLRYELSNLVPACWNCNGLKGSLSHDEYRHECHI